MGSRLQRSIEDMGEFCPNLVYDAVPPSAGGGGAWNGLIQPTVSLDGLEHLLDDIRHNRPVYCAPRGELKHLATCETPHCRHLWMDQIGELRVPFTVSIYYSGGRDHPRCWVVSPSIPTEKRRHTWGDGSICPFLASEDSWVWDRDTVADFVPHISIWLLTWLVFDQTAQWIVGEREGTPEYHLSVIRASDQCWCRSGRKYRKCHMPEGQIQAARLAFGALR